MAERVALELLGEHGIEVIWNLHLTASDAHHHGHHEAAKGLMEIADAAEEICARAIGKLDRDRGPMAYGIVL